MLVSRALSTVAAAEAKRSCAVILVFAKIRPAECSTAPPMFVVEMSTPQAVAGCRQYLSHERRLGELERGNLLN